MRTGWRRGKTVLLRYKTYAYSNDNLRAGQWWRLSHGMGRSGNEDGNIHDWPDWETVDGKKVQLQKWKPRRQWTEDRIQRLRKEMIEIEHREAELMKITNIRQPHRPRISTQQNMEPGGKQWKKNHPVPPPRDPSKPSKSEDIAIRSETIDDESMRKYKDATALQG